MPAYVAWQADMSNWVVVPLGPPGWESIPGLPKSFTNKGSGYSAPLWRSIQVRTKKEEIKDKSMKLNEWCKNKKIKNKSGIGAT